MSGGLSLRRQGTRLTPYENTRQGQSAETPKQMSRSKQQAQDSRARAAEPGQQGQGSRAWAAAGPGQQQGQGSATHQVTLHLLLQVGARVAGGRQLGRQLGDLGVAA